MKTKLFFIFAIFITIFSGLVSAQLDHEIEPIPPGADVFPTELDIDLKIEDGPEVEDLELVGDTIVRRTGPPIVEGEETTIPIEIVAMQLTGFDPSIGNIIITEDPSLQSTGELKFERDPICSLEPINFVPGESFFDVVARIHVELPEIERGLTIELEGDFGATKTFDIFPPVTTELHFDLEGEAELEETMELKIQRWEMSRVMEPGDSFYNTNFYNLVVPLKPVAANVDNVIQSSDGLLNGCGDCILNCGNLPAWDTNGRLSCISDCYVSEACQADGLDGDFDSDEVIDNEDNCPGISNPDQSDLDEDSFGDICDCGLIEPEVHAGASEICDGLDNNCNGFVDEENGCFVDPVMCGFTDPELLFSVVEKTSGDFIGEFPEIVNVGETNYVELPISTCDAEGGFIAECIPSKVVQKSTLGANVSLNQTNASSQFANNVTRDTIATGINNTPYNATTYDCDDFANNLETNLTALGYNATFTAIWCYDGAGNTIINHAITDVHAPDGTILFIEPQTNQLLNLDADGDGVVEFRTHHSPRRADTDNRCEIEVYDNRASAAAAGVPID